MRDPARVQVGELLRRRAQGRDLVLEHAGGEVAGDRPVPGRPAARRAAAVRHDDREPLLGEPLRGEEHAGRLDHPLRAGPPYGSMQHRQLACPGWCHEGKQHGGADPAGPALDEARRRVRQVRLSARARRCPRRRARPRRIRTRDLAAGQRPAGHHGRPAAGLGAVHAGLGGDRGAARPGRSARRRARWTRSTPANSTSSPSVPRTARTCSPAGVTGAAAASSAAGAMTSPRVSSLIPVQTMSPLPSWAGTPVDDVGPVRVGVLADHLAGGGVDEPHGLLVAGLHDDQQVAAPGRVDQVREAARSQPPPRRARARRRVPISPRDRAAPPVAAGARHSSDTSALAVPAAG